MFRKLDVNQQQEISFYFEGKKIAAFNGETVASALLRSGELYFGQTSKSKFRGPYCMMGVCFDCLVDVDEKQSLQSCQVIVKNNMQIKRHKIPSSSP